MGKLISTKDMPREEWLKYRRKGIGGSDAGAICGVNPYSTALKVYQDKTSEEPGIIDSESMRQGRDLEDYVARRFMEATGKKVRKSNFMYQHDSYPFMLADIDRMVVGEDAGLECKTASAFSADKWKDDEVPEHYILQCMHYMAVTGTKAWYIAVVLLGKEFKWKKIERDDEMIRDLIKIEQDFWFGHVVPRIMPEPDGSKEYDELLNRYFHTARKASTIPLVGFDEKLARRQEILDLTEKLETEKAKIDQELKLYLADTETAESAKYRVFWINTTTNRLDSRLLKSEQPEIYERYIKTMPGRRFSVRAIA